MAELIRFGVSIDGDLLTPFDAQIARKGYTNRSEALRDLIRDSLVAEEWAAGGETIGTITLVFDHHTPDLPQHMLHLQHSFPGDIKSVLHIHLDHSNCLEVIVVQGEGKFVKGLADQLSSLRGIKHGKLTMTTTGKELPSAGGHHARGHGHEHEDWHEHDGHIHAHEAASTEHAHDHEQPPSAETKTNKTAKKPSGKRGKRG